jgi:hypothetical protein
MSVELAKRFPRIERYLEAKPDGCIHSRYLWWEWAKDRLTRTEQAAAYEEWADFHEWHLSHRAEELARDHLLRRLVEQWTDEMAYLLRRSACYARGEDPGEWIPSWVRRPDLAAERPADQARNGQLAAAG